MPDVVLYVLLPLIVLLVSGAVVGWLRRTRRDELAAEPPVTPLELRERVRELCERGRQVEAIKLLREARPGLGLRQAKQMVDAVAAGGPLRPPREAVAPDLLPPALHQQVLRLGERGKIPAIKLVRDAIPGLPLKRAKDLVEAALRGAPPAVASPARPAIGADLAARVRALKTEGRREQAVFLVCGETGMNQDEASAFVDAVEPEAGIA